MTGAEGKQLKEGNVDFPLQCYHSYEEHGTSMHKYHIDTHPALRLLIKPELHQYGGNLSVRLTQGTRPLMLIGQDESTFHQFIFSNRYWKGPEGLNFIQPKSQGDILMLSGMQAREFGLRLSTLLSEDMRNIKIQLEDCVDCLEVIFPAFDFAFLLFDQSSGHTKLRVDGLNVNNMNVSHGGVINEMHNTEIKELGPFTAQLSIDDTQVILFGDKDACPFWMTPEERITLKEDEVVEGFTTKEKNKSELLIELKPGWFNKPKGMLQVLWERGWINNKLVSFVVSILFTPKFHCELAGEGIEYAWGAAKRMYRRQPIQMKRSIVNFKKLITQSLKFKIGMELRK